MSFERPAGMPLFTATIGDSNAAFLDGSTVPLAEYASAAITLPLDLDLWHRRLAHHHLEGVKKLLKKILVTGMTLDFLTAPDPICEPCPAGKMHANPFPPSEWRASLARPLELVHSDVHQVPYASFSGVCYWITFIDDYSRYHFVLPIKAKSDVFEAFKTFKAYAENQSRHTIKILRDDKGGEYMSNAFLQFTTSCGIERQHSSLRCTAYVHIQKDKRQGLGSHMEKCVFIGYPQGYKGWKFYNPTTKKTVTVASCSTYSFHFR
jgi:hypothetical protein